MSTYPTNGPRPSGRDAMRAAVELCADCTSCMDLMEPQCRFFAELFPLEWIRGRDEPLPEAAVRNLAEACTYCGLCPCPQVPAWITEGKSAYAGAEGLPLSVRLLEDVPRLARLCGTLPRVYEALESTRPVQGIVRKVGGIHPDRGLPRFARESFFGWAARTGHSKRQDGARHVAYFAGCTVGYLFPDVGRAVVTVLERNGLPVYVPPQQCCGMPFLVEGDLPRAQARVKSSVDSLLEASRAGDDLVTSCPTCGFMLRVLLKENAYLSDEYQQSVGAAADEFRFPNPDGTYRAYGRSNYATAIRDDGFFSSIPPLDRIEVAEHLVDAGDYLFRLLAQGGIDTGFAPVRQRVAYFPPCHQRQQKIGRPYVDLLRLVPELTVDVVGENDCCGMGGSEGFKADVHDVSLAVGRPLFEAIEKLDPDAIVTDCLSCRLQFNHALGYPVVHPIEILARVYGG